MEAHTRCSWSFTRFYPHLSRLRQAFQSYLESTLFQFNSIDQYLPTFYVSDFIRPSVEESISVLR